MDGNEADAADGELQSELSPHSTRLGLGRVRKSATENQTKTRQKQKQNWK